MGTWGAGLEESDYFLDVYGRFQELLNRGISIHECTNAVMLEFLDMSWDELMDDDDHTEDNIEFLNTLDDNDLIEFFLALAKAQKEVSALHPYVLDFVRLIVETKSNLRLLRELDADEEFLEERERVLNQFLKELQA